jgi:hypothetical protein
LATRLVGALGDPVRRRAAAARGGAVCRLLLVDRLAVDRLRRVIDLLLDHDGLGLGGQGCSEDGGAEEEARPAQHAAVVTVAAVLRAAHLDLHARLTGEDAARAVRAAGERRRGGEGDAGQHHER